MDFVALAFQYPTAGEWYNHLIVVVVEVRKPAEEQSQVLFLARLFLLLVQRAPRKYEACAVIPGLPFAPESYMPAPLVSLSNAGLAAGFESQQLIIIL